MSLDIKLKKADRIYHRGEKLTGSVVVTSNGKMSHNGIKLNLEGTVTLTPSAKSVGLIESFYNSTKPVQLIQYSIDLAKPGKFEDGETPIPFEFNLEPLISTGPLYETYHGVYVNIHYLLKADMERPLLAKNLTKTTEFILENIPEKAENIKPFDFKVTPESLENVKKQSMKNIPKFKIVGHLDSVVCNINRPFTGTLKIEQVTSIKSIEIQLVRVETCGCAEGFAKEATEIQNIQIADGNVPTGTTIPIFMIFPRLFTAPTLAAKNFKIEFEINLVVILGDGYLITENFPIKLFRQETKDLIGSF